jgi:hypothetical protein
MPEIKGQHPRRREMRGEVVERLPDFPIGRLVAHDVEQQAHHVPIGPQAAGLRGALMERDIRMRAPRLLEHRRARLQPFDRDPARAQQSGVPARAATYVEPAAGRRLPGRDLLQHVVDFGGVVLLPVERVVPVRVLAETRAHARDRANACTASMTRCWSSPVSPKPPGR